MFLGVGRCVRPPRYIYVKLYVLYTSLSVCQWVSVCAYSCFLCACVCVAPVSVCAHVYTHALPLPDRVKLWADTFGQDLYNTVTKYSGSLLLQKVSNPLPGSSKGGQRAVSQGLPPGGEAESSNPQTSML